MPPRLAAVALLLFGSCATVENWNEVRSGPSTLAEVYDAVEYLARTGGYAPSSPDCDRGLGTWVSRWRFRQIGLNRPGRYRLRAEVLVDEVSEDRGWTVRYLVQQQKVKDLERSHNPTEDDWSEDGQHTAEEETFGARLQRRLAPPAADAAAPLPGTPDRPR